MLEAKGIDPEELPEDKPLTESSADGRGFAASGGVAQAVVNYIKTIDPEREVKVASAEGLADCRKLIQLAKAGKYNGYLLEGMACPGGCVAGAGTICGIPQAIKFLEKAKKDAPNQQADSTRYADLIPDLENFDMTLRHAHDIED